MTRTGQEVRWVEANLRLAMSCYARSTPGGEAIDLPGLRLVYSGVRQAVFNPVMLNEPVRAATDLRRRLERAHDYFRRRNQAWSLWLCNELLDADQRLACFQAVAEAGLAALMNPPALYASRITPPRRKLPALEFRRVASPVTRIDFCHVMSMAFDGGFAELREAYDSDEFWREGFEGRHGFEGYVGYAAGRAVTTACTVCDDRAVGVYGVSTSPHEQRKGYGEAMVRHAITQAAAARGLERSVLQSSPAGLPLYRTLGFRAVGGFSIHVSV